MSDYVDFDYEQRVIAGSPAIAFEVQDNFDKLLQWIKDNFRQKNDLPNLTQQLVLPGEPTIDSHAVNLGFAKGLIPAGVVVDFAGAAVPDDGSGVPQWAWCDGSERSDDDPVYARLFAAIGYLYGGSAGAGTFNLPDFRDRVAVGVGAGSSVGDTGGVADQKVMAHTHTASHNHSGSGTASDNVHNHVLDGGVDDDTAPHTHSTPAHSHTAELAHYASASRVLGGGGGTSVALGQESGAESAWTGTGIRQSNSSGSGTTGPASGTNARHGHTDNFSIRDNSHSHTLTVTVNTKNVTTSESGSDTPAAGDNYPPFVTVNKIIKL